MNKLSPHGIQEPMWRQESALSCARARVSTTVGARRGQQRSQRSPVRADTDTIAPAACDVEQNVEKPVGLQIQRVERGVRVAVR